LGEGQGEGRFAVSSQRDNGLNGNNVIAEPVKAQHLTALRKIAAFSSQVSRA
jgi:hypothetical protein